MTAPELPTADERISRCSTDMQAEFGCGPRKPYITVKQVQEYTGYSYGEVNGMFHSAKLGPFVISGDKGGGMRVDYRDFATFLIRYYGKPADRTVGRGNRK